MDASVLPNYEAEVAYTWAALERESGNFAIALTHAELGMRQAKRVSSKRNGQFLVAGIAALMGDSARARSLFDAGVAADYRGQGGDGLTRFAAFLDSLSERQAAALLKSPAATLTCSMRPQRVPPFREVRRFAGDRLSTQRTS